MMKEQDWNTEKYELEITNFQFCSEGLIEVYFIIDNVASVLTVDASVSDFDRFAPEVEGNLWDLEGKYTARFDKFGNLHWLITDFEGHVIYRVVNCNQIIEELIYAKHTD